MLSQIGKMQHVSDASTKNMTALERHSTRDFEKILALEVSSSSEHASENSSDTPNMLGSLHKGSDLGLNVNMEFSHDTRETTSNETRRFENQTKDPQVFDGIMTETGENLLFSNNQVTPDQVLLKFNIDLNIFFIKSILIFRLPTR
jgi:hypothetical protein